jgi:hypothetical protein
MRQQVKYMKNKSLILIILFIFITIIYAEDINSNINAEYCLYEDTNIPESYIFPSRWQLKISSLIEDLDKISLQKEKLSCKFWQITEKYALINNEELYLNIDSPVMIVEEWYIDIKGELIGSFLSANPEQSYDLRFKKKFDLFDSLVNKRIFVKWIKISTCKGKKDSIIGGYYIKIKGRCNTKDLLWNAKYDMHKIPSPIDTLDLEEKLRSVKYDMCKISGLANILDFDKKLLWEKCDMLWSDEYNINKFLKLWSEKYGTAKIPKPIYFDVNENQ